jgi:hypothetical protein
MYKLLLVTDRDEVIRTLQEVGNLADLYLAPVTILQDVQQAIHYMETNAVDAVAYSLHHTDAQPLHQYLIDVRPSLPVFQAHSHLHTWQEELKRTRSFLDRLHADDSDEVYDPEAVREYMRDELLDQLLGRQIKTRDELMARLKLVRAELAMEKHAFLFDFDLPQGEVYLVDRWHYGRERLASALRNNFFGRYVDDIFYGVAVLSPRHIRLLACQRYDGQSEGDLAELTSRVQQHVEGKLRDIKEYLDLDLNIEQYTMLSSIGELTDEGPKA